MLQGVVDGALGVAKESFKTFSQESFSNFVKLLNGFSALLLAVLPGKNSALEGVAGWDQQTTFVGPLIPKWMEEGVSSFNKFIHDFDFDSPMETDEISEYATDTEDDMSVPSSPTSQASRLSRSSSLSRSGHVRKSSLLRRLLRKLLGPIRWVLGVLGTPPAGFNSRTGGEGLRRSNSSSASLHVMLSLASKRFSDVKDLVVNHRTTDSRRRGIIEDLQLGVEIFIENAFDVVHRWIYHFIFPMDTFKAIVRTALFMEPLGNDDSEMTVIQKATLGDSDPSIKHEKRYEQTLNTDARTCEDFITALGYPYEALKVTTADGYILSLERIPRPNSRKVVYLQHGILDSALGWVSCGVVGSQAFAAFDQGCDVFLGNFRGLASRDHVNKNISASSYWRYSVNEHGTQDIPAMLDKVHEIKTNELKKLNLLNEDGAGSSSEAEFKGTLRYSLCGVSHSLGGAAMLIYLITRRLEGKPHHMSRAILLSPAGFHDEAPLSCRVLQYVLPFLAPILRPIVPGIYIPTKFFRMLFNKLSRDFQNYPALGGLVQTLISYVVGGDPSNWIGAFGMTHYNMEDMPGIAFGVALHLGQMMRNKSFMMYDYGSPRANNEVYGTPSPLDVGLNYGVIDIPVDVVAGTKDKLIPKSMVARHYHRLKETGVNASYSEFEYAHLDFTFSNRDEVLDYVTSRLLLSQPRTSSKLKRNHRSKSVKGSKRLWGQASEGGEGLDDEFSKGPSAYLRSRSSVDCTSDLNDRQSVEEWDCLDGVTMRSTGLYGENAVTELPQCSQELQEEDNPSSESVQRSQGTSLAGLSQASQEEFREENNSSLTESSEQNSQGLSHRSRMPQL